MTTTEQKIKAKIKGREWAAFAFECVKGSWEDGTGAQYADAFLEEMRKLLPCKKEDEPKPPEKPEPIARLGAKRVLHCSSNTAIDEIPMKNLRYKLEYAELVKKLLTAYLNHPEIESYRGTE